MIRALIPVALLLVPAAADAQTTPAKSAAKASTKPAAKPKSKPAVPKVPTPLDRAEKDGFGVAQVAAPDAAKFMAAWKVGAGSKATSTQTIANQPLFTFLIFRGCKANGVGLCDVVADFVITRPDGTINDENKGIVVWNKAAPIDPKRPYLGDGALGYGTDDEGPFGDYRVVATITDRVAGVTVTTEQTLTIAPPLKSATPSFDLPPAPKSDEPAPGTPAPADPAPADPAVDPPK